MHKIKKEKIADKIYALGFSNKKELASTFLRFEEYYESPRFKGKIFSLNEFIKWYKQQKGAFTYYSDWSGFNIPSYALKPFYDGKFNPLSKKEKRFLNFFKDEKGRFYIVGIYGKKEKSALRHELAHAFFYLYRDYKMKVLSLLKKADLKEAREVLIEKGYCKDVLEDEIHAYIIAPSKKVNFKISNKIKSQINALFEDYLKSKINK